MVVEKATGPRRRRVLDAINHRTPDQTPVDFGSSAVTGMHVSCVAALREHYGLEPRLVKVCEPYQMLGLIEDDLAGGDRDRRRPAVQPHQHVRLRESGLEALDVQRPDRARAGRLSHDDRTGEGRHADLSQGRHGARGRAATCPRAAISSTRLFARGAIDTEHLDPQDNTEQYQLLTEAQLDGIEEDARAVNARDNAVLASLVNTALGDIAFVPAPDLTRSERRPRRRRMVHADGEPPRGRSQDFRAPGRNRHRQPRQDQQTGRRRDRRDLHLRHGLRHADLVVLLDEDLRQPVEAALRGSLRLDSQEHDLEDVQALLRRVRAVFRIDDRRRRRHHQSRSMLGERHGSRGSSRTNTRAASCSGAAASTPSTRCPSARPRRCAPKCCERCEIFSEGGGFVFDSIHNVQAARRPRISSR